MRIRKINDYRFASIPESIHFSRPCSLTVFLIGIKIVTFRIKGQSLTRLFFFRNFSNFTLNLLYEWNTAVQNLGSISPWELIMTRNQLDSWTRCI